MAELDNSLAGRWTNEEHEKFILGIQLYGKNWKKIQEMLSTRNCSQIRSHAQKYFLKLKKDKHHSSQPHHEQSSINEISLDHQHSTGHAKPQQSNSYSYFMNKIMEFTRSHQRMDIWDALIDSGTPKETVTPDSYESLEEKKPNQKIHLLHSLRKYSEASFVSD